MKTKKNLPNIPLYIGDWEKDCNVLSLKSEAAWLRVIFKMFTNGKQSTYKVPTNGLQNLWRVSAQEVQEIIQEFQDYNICEVTIDGRFTTFLSRRFERENKISDVRSKAVNNRSDRVKKPEIEKKSPYKTSTKNIQTPDIENENRNEDLLEKGVVGEKTESRIEARQNRHFADEGKIAQFWIESVSRHSKLTPKELFVELDNFCDYLDATFDIKQSTKDFRSHFTNWVCKDRKNPTSGLPTPGHTAQRGITYKD